MKVENYKDVEIIVTIGFCALNLTSRETYKTGKK